jgi:hypothetical protein
MLTMNGREYVLVPAAEYRRLRGKERGASARGRSSRKETRVDAQDRRDAAVAAKALAQWRAGKLRTVSHAQVKHELGL